LFGFSALGCLILGLRATRISNALDFVGHQPLPAQVVAASHFARPAGDRRHHHAELVEYAGLFSSTTIIIGGLFALLGTTDRASELVREIPFAVQTAVLILRPVSSIATFSPPAPAAWSGWPPKPSTMVYGLTT
jgi:hypothetical protein